MKGSKCIRQWPILSVDPFNWIISTRISMPGSSGTFLIQTGKKEGKAAIASTPQIHATSSGVVR
jgi:hypothetical protein